MSMRQALVRSTASFSTLRSRSAQLAGSRLARHRACAAAQVDPTDPIELVLTASGPDRLGVVADITSAVVRSGGSIGTSHSITVRDTFTSVMEVSVPSQVLPHELAGEVHRLLPDYQTTLQQCGSRSGGAHTGRFTASVVDDQGVFELARAMERCDLSLTSLHTEPAEALSGGTTYKMEGAVGGDAPIDVERLHRTLDRLVTPDRLVSFEVDAPAEHAPSPAAAMSVSAAMPDAAPARSNASVL
jgi:glycine cleavage system regulatory protein